MDRRDLRCTLLSGHFRAAVGVELRTTFYWPEYPRGPTAGYTAPVQAWVETTIEGLTTERIVLRGDYSQTYRPGHHNFWEEFIFDPKLEPGVSEKQLAELIAADIDLLYVSADERRESVFALGADGKLRPL